MADDRETLLMLDSRASLVASADGIILTLIMTALDRIEDFLRWACPLSITVLVIVNILLAISIIISIWSIAPRKPLLRPVFTTLREGVEKLTIFNKEVEKIMINKLKLLRISFGLFALAVIFLSLTLLMFFIFNIQI
jgi:hypothetical protein